MIHTAVLAVLVALCSHARQHTGYIDRGSAGLMSQSSHAILSPNFTHCNIHRAALTRAVVDTLFFSPVEELMRDLGHEHVVYNATLCVFKPSRDVFHEFHDKRDAFTHQGVHCCFCGKKFSTQAYLDNHMVRRHSDQLGSGADVCLAEYCDMLWCDEADVKVASTLHLLPCFPKRLEALRRQCFDQLEGCRPVITNMSQLANETLFHNGIRDIIHSICHRLTCKYVEDIPVRTSRYIKELLLKFITIATLVCVGAAVLFYLWVVVQYIRQQRRLSRSDRPAFQSSKVPKAQVCQESIRQQHVF